MPERFATNNDLTSEERLLLCDAHFLEDEGFMGVEEAALIDQAILGMIQWSNGEHVVVYSYERLRFALMWLGDGGGPPYPENNGAEIFQMRWDGTEDEVTEMFDKAIEFTSTFLDQNWCQRGTDHDPIVVWEDVDHHFDEENPKLHLKGKTCNIMSQNSWIDD